MSIRNRYIVISLHPLGKYILYNPDIDQILNYGNLISSSCNRAARDSKNIIRIIYLLY